MRLTIDLIARRPQFINPLKERELDLRGQRIPAIENLSATQDQFDVIDLTNNDLKRLESATTLHRLRMLIVSNNKINRISDGLGAAFPRLEWLVLCNNDLDHLNDLDPLASLTSLRHLALTDNSVAKLPEYRLYVLSLLPALRVLDFQKVKLKEVAAAKAKFGAAVAAARQRIGTVSAGGKRVREGEDDQADENREGGKDSDGPAAKAARPSGLADHLRKAAMKAIAEATSLAEVAKIERALKTGDAEALEAVLRGAPAAD